jgi:hypothetical protein
LLAKYLIIRSCNLGASFVALVGFFFLDTRVFLSWDMEAKKAVLEQAIASLRAAISLGALGMPGDVVMQPPTGALALSGNSPLVGGSEIPQGAFFGKSIPDSVIAK